MRKIAGANDKPEKKKRILLNIAIAGCILVALTCAGMFVGQMLEYKKGDRLMEEAAQYAGWGTYEEGEEPKFVVDFDALRAVNPEVCGWLYSEGTVINYPILQSADNDYYLTHTLEGETHKYGSIFVDCNSQGDFSDANTLIHGHRMNSGAMFGSIVKYAEQEYYEQHPVLMLYTPAGEYRLEIFAAYEIPASMEYVPLKFASDAEYRAYLDRVYEKSLIRTGVAVGTGDRIVTLSTCTKTDSQKRFLAQAKLVPVSS